MSKNFCPSLCVASQWETTSHCNVVSHWMGAYTKSSLCSQNNTCPLLFYILFGLHVMPLLQIYDVNITIWRCLYHDDIIKWKHFPRYWPFVRRIQRSPVNSPHSGQWRGALMFSLICVWINDWVNNREAGDLRRYRAHYDVIVMGSFSQAIY